MFLAVNVWQIVLIVLAVIAVILVILYFVGSKLQAKQANTEKTMKQMSMVVSLLVLSKDKLHIKDSGLMKQVQDAIPAYMRWRKFPIVKARIIKANIAGGAQVMSFICDPKVFKVMPVKTEVKVTIAGIYITKLHSAKGVDLSKLNK
ncbi:MAG: hypothetical protein J6M39_04975 [Lachnospiraceae bacterium]|nr:hypothetical protein [Lachnospiraceae bacterium]